VPTPLAPGPATASTSLLQAFFPRPRAATPARSSPDLRAAAIACAGIVVGVVFVGVASYYGTAALFGPELGEGQTAPTLEVIGSGGWLFHGVPAALMGVCVISLYFGTSQMHTWDWLMMVGVLVVGGVVCAVVYPFFLVFASVGCGATDIATTATVATGAANVLNPEVWQSTAGPMVLWTVIGVLVSPLLRSGRLWSLFFRKVLLAVVRLGG